MSHILTPHWGEDLVIPGLTYNELHSIGLGTVGYWLGQEGRADVAFLLALLAITLPADKDASMARRTISEDSWYFVGSLFFWYNVGKVTTDG